MNGRTLRGQAHLVNSLSMHRFFLPVLLLTIFSANAGGTDSGEAPEFPADFPEFHKEISAWPREAYEEALSYFGRLAREGDREAQVQIARVFEEGLGRPKNWEIAAEWYRVALAQGDPHAKFKLEYSKGAEAPPDPDEAIAWYRKAVDQGFSHAMYELGSLYLDGKEIAEDQDEALEWLHRAAEKGHEQAQFVAAYTYFKGPSEDKNRKEVADWYKKGAERGYRPAQFGLGRMYAEGRGVPKDPVQAYAWLGVSVAMDWAGEEEKAMVAERLTEHQFREAEALLKEYVDRYGQR